MILSTLVSFALLLPTPAKDTDRVLVVQNSDSPISVAVASDYLKRRHVSNMVSIHCPDSAISAANETVKFKVYQESLETPVRAFLAKHPLIDFIVLTKGVPIRISDAPGRGLGNHQPSLDSYLAALDYEKDPKVINVPINDSGFTGTAWSNKFWRSTVPFTHAKFGGYLVTRLDGYTQEDAIALTTHSLQAELKKPTGTVLLDTCKPFGYADKSTEPLELFATPPEPGKTLPPMPDIGYKHFNADMQRAKDILYERKINYELDMEDAFVGNREDLIGYTSWGSNDKFFKMEAYHSLKFAPGAVCDTAVSTSGRTFLPTSSGQSLIADLIAQGVTGVKGYCDEPLLTAIASPTILFERYTRGWTLAESFYAASRFVGWEDIVIGDPLCRPFAVKPSAPTSMIKPKRKQQ